jgi:hypothetical protein
MPELYAGVLEAPPHRVTVDPRTKAATFSDLSLSAPGRYFMKFSCISSTTGEMNRFIGESIDVHPQNYTAPEISVERRVSCGSKVVEGR